MERTSRQIRIKETPLNVSYLRRQTDPLAPWVIMLHGLQSNSDVFLSLCLRPFLKAYSILALDFIGFGHSSKPTSFSYDLLDQKKVLEGILKEENIKECIVIGHSMGGMVGTLLLTSPTINVVKFACLEGNLRPEDGVFSTTVSEMDFLSFEKNISLPILTVCLKGMAPKNHDLPLSVKSLDS